MLTWAMVSAAVEGGMPYSKHTLATEKKKKKRNSERRLIRSSSAGVLVNTSPCLGSQLKYKGYERLFRWHNVHLGEDAMR